jgi:stearoyl-CoA desaturase (delta-9 desaturase)
VLKGQIDIAARTIGLAERLGWVSDVRWPDAARLTAKEVDETRKFGSMTRRTAAKPAG